MHSSLLEEMGNSTINAEDSWVNDLDPMLEGGYRIAYNRACPFEVRQKT